MTFFSRNNGDHLGLWLHLLVTQKTTHVVKMFKDFLIRQISYQLKQKLLLTNTQQPSSAGFDPSAPPYP